MTIRPIIIEVNWSYPTSPNAVKAGMTKTGCWTVSRINRKKNGERNLPLAISHFATKEEANSFAQSYVSEIVIVTKAQ